MTWHCCISYYSVGSHPKGQPPASLPYTSPPPPWFDWCSTHTALNPSFIYIQIPLLPFLPFNPPFCHTPTPHLERTRHRKKQSQGDLPSLRSMADQWWDSTSHRSHGASACSAAAPPPPLTVMGGRLACGWASPTAAAAESTSSVTFQDPCYRSSTHQQPLSDAASSLGDPHMDWTQAFL